MTLGRLSDNALNQSIAPFGQPASAQRTRLWSSSWLQFEIFASLSDRRRQQPHGHCNLGHCAAHLAVAVATPVFICNPTRLGLLFNARRLEKLKDLALMSDYGNVNSNINLNYLA